jgi:predicted DNA binding CopG/RHH family protein
MNYFELNNEEEQILADFETGTLESVTPLARQKTALRSAARHTLSKSKNINIRLSQKDLVKLKAKASREGIPYQTLAASILHKITNE